MNNTIVTDSLELNINHIKRMWILLRISIISIVSLVFLFVIYHILISYTNPQGNPIEPVDNKFPVDLLLENTMIFLLLVGGMFSLSILGMNYQIDKVIIPYFDAYKIKRSKRFTGVIRFPNNIEINVKYSNKGYFILNHNTDKFSYAKPSELYWKMLNFMNYISDNT